MRPEVIRLRPYQEKAVALTGDALSAKRSALVVMPTGTGKTTFFSEMARTWSQKGRVLVLAHREELISQAAERIRTQTGVRVGIEMADSRSSILSPEPVVVASVQTLCRSKRRAKFEAEEFALIIIDEAHHSTSKSYRQILEHFPEARVLGVTATPDRTDEVGLYNVFEHVAFTYDIEDAIRDGYLCKVKQMAVYCKDFDVSNVRTKMGDLSESDLQQVMQLETVLHQIAMPLVRETQGRQTIVFAPGVKAAHALSDVLSRYTTAQVGVVDGAMDKEQRRATLDAYAKGEIQYLVNCQVLTEGYDAPATSCVAVARPTKSRSLYTQMVGRGLRTHPGKEDCLILDFYGNAGKHKLCCPLDVLGGQGLPDDIREMALAMARNGPIGLEEAVLKAHEQKAEQVRAKLIKSRSMTAKLRSIDYTTEEVSPFGMLMLDAKVSERNALEPGLTDKQKAFLERSGIDAGQASKMGIRQASKAIDAIVDRRRKNLCTYKQAALLLRFGYSPDVTMVEAKRILDELAASGWRKRGTFTK